MKRYAAAYDPMRKEWYLTDLAGPDGVLPVDSKDDLRAVARALNERDDLLAALQAVLEASESGSLIYPDSAVVRAARTAIAKAGGAK